MSDNDSGAKGAPAKTGNVGMKKILMIVGLVVLVAGVGVGGWWLGKRGAKSPSQAGAAGKLSVDAEIKADAGGKGSAGDGAGVEKKAAEGEKKAEGGKKEGAATSEPSKADLTCVFDKFTTNLSDDLNSFVQMKLEVEATSAESKSLIDANIAPLRDATLMVLSTKSKSDLQTLAGKERLKRELLARYQGVLNSDKAIRNLYVTEFTVVTN
jgi:flagellar FliL protein